MPKQNVKKAKKHLAKLRELMSKRKYLLSTLKKEVIDTLCKTREEIGDIYISEGGCREGNNQGRL